MVITVFSRRTVHLSCEICKCGAFSVTHSHGLNTLSIYSSERELTARRGNERRLKSIYRLSIHEIRSVDIYVHNRTE